tara:strand:+ start:419 stop:631 length:213 start_codon:yes stop_codon:yes gene_type:complete
MNVYEVLSSYTATEVWHVKAKNEEEALKKFKKGAGEFYKTFDGPNNHDLLEVADEWKLADFVDRHGELEA